MKTGKTLTELATEIVRQQKAKKDYLVTTDSIEMVGNNTDVQLAVPPIAKTFDINELAHSQIGQYLKIPTAYYDRMRIECPELLRINVNHWFSNKQENPEQRMIRTLDGNVRAFLSDRYRRIDNDQIAETVLPILSSIDGLKIVSCEITETRMYIKAVNQRIEDEVSVGDIVQSGIVVSNSEVGCGSVAISPLVYRLVCTNGMIAADRNLRKVHAGRNLEMQDDYSIYRSETIEADDKALLMKIEDTVRSAMDEAHFKRIVQEMRKATKLKVGGAEIPKVVELTSKHTGISQYESSGILGYLIESGDLSLYGIANAVTRYAQDVESYDRSTELEAIGYKIITMSPRLWTSITEEARDSI